jgi:transposase
MACLKTFTPKLPGIVKWRHSSEPYRRDLFERHHDGICARKLAQKERIGEATVERIYHQFTELKAKEKESSLCPRYLGIDEHTLHKQHRFCTTFCDLKRRRVFEVHPGKSEEELADFLATLRGRERVRMVCIDLSSPYRRLVRKWFPNAKIVADRFHAIRLVYIHCMDMMRAIAPQIRGHRGYLVALRKAPNKLTPRQQARRDALLRENPQLRPIYEQMHHLRKLLKHKRQRRRQCKGHIKALLKAIQWLRDTDLSPLIKLAQSLQRWTEPIVLMWRFSKNNAITEGFHRKMKLIQRRAYGFKNFNNYRLRVIAQCG